MLITALLVELCINVALVRKERPAGFPDLCVIFALRRRTRQIVFRCGRLSHISLLKRVFLKFHQSLQVSGGR